MTDLITAEDAKKLLDECDSDGCLTCEYARSVIALHAQLADAQAAQAAVAERCAEVPFTEAFFCLPGSPQDQTLTAVAEAIRALAPASGVETLAKLRARAEKAEAEIERLKDPRTAARLICDEVLQKPSDEAAAMREAMVKATMGTKVPALTGEVRWSVVNDALRALAALARPHATKGEAG